MAKISKKNTEVSSSNLVKVQNSLLEAFIKSNNLTAIKILFYIAKHYKTIPDGGELIKVNLNTKDLCAYCNIDQKTLKRNVRQMTETSISVIDDKAESFISIIPRVKFNYSGSVELEIFKQIMEFVVEVRNKYTAIDAEQIMRLSIKHSARMLMLLSRISNFSEHVPKRKRYELVELNAMFGTNYKRLGQFEQKILIPVKQELDKTSKLSFEYSVNYDKDGKLAGRPKAVAITLDILINNPQPTLF